MQILTYNSGKAKGMSNDDGARALMRATPRLLREHAPIPPAWRGSYASVPPIAARDFINLFDDDQNGNIDAGEFAKFYRSLLGGDAGSGAQARAKEVDVKGKKGKKK